MAQIRVQIPYKKYGVIEITADTKELSMEQAKALIDKHSNVEEIKKEITGFVKPNEKQLGLIKRLGGDVNKQFTKWDEVSQYIDTLKSKQDGNAQQAQYQSKPQVATQPATANNALADLENILM